MSVWNSAQEWELNWHLNNPFIYREQLKQEVYAEKMGLELDCPDNNLQKKSVLDIGGGESSILLKYNNFTNSVVTDPLANSFPEWVRKRYEEHHLSNMPVKGEELSETGFDEVWIYNCLQHTERPSLIIKNARKAGKIIRIFEWIEEPISPGHIHTLHEKELNSWLDGKGKTEQVNDRGCHGLCYYGIFKGNLYDN